MSAFCPKHGTSIHVQAADRPSRGSSGARRTRPQTKLALASWRICNIMRRLGRSIMQPFWSVPPLLEWRTKMRKLTQAGHAGSASTAQTRPGSSSSATSARALDICFREADSKGLSNLNRWLKALLVPKSQKRYVGRCRLICDCRQLVHAF